MTTLDSTAVPIFVDILVELANIIFVNSTDITTNIETAARSRSPGQDRTRSPWASHPSRCSTARYCSSRQTQTQLPADSIPCWHRHWCCQRQPARVPDDPGLLEFVHDVNFAPENTWCFHPWASSWESRRSQRSPPPSSSSPRLTWPCQCRWDHQAQDL